MTSIEIKPQEHQPAENPLLGALHMVAGLVARHGLTAERIAVENGGRNVSVSLWEHPEPLSLEQVQELAAAWGAAIGVSRLHVGEARHVDPQDRLPYWGRLVSVSGRVGQMDVHVYGMGAVPTQVVEVAS